MLALPLLLQVLAPLLPLPLLPLPLLPLPLLPLPPLGLQSMLAEEPAAVATATHRPPLVEPAEVCSALHLALRRAALRREARELPK